MCLYVGIHVPRWRSEDNPMCEPLAPNIFAKFWVLFLLLFDWFWFYFFCFVFLSVCLLACSIFTRPCCPRDFWDSSVSVTPPCTLHRTVKTQMCTTVTNFMCTLGFEGFSLRSSCSMANALPTIACLKFFFFLIPCSRNI